MVLLVLLAALLPVFAGDAQSPRGQQSFTSQQCISSALEANRRSDLAFTVSRTSDDIRVRLRVHIPASSVHVKQSGEKSQAVLTWVIVQRDQLSGKPFGEVWKGDVEVNLLPTPESLGRFRRDGIQLEQGLVSSENADLQIVVCDTQSGKIGTRTISAYERPSRK